MMKAIDLNADLGEKTSSSDMNCDADLLKIVTSANIACGFHAGDPLQMSQIVEQALANNVTIGAHPGFNDRQGFGRRRIYDLSAKQLASDLIYQIGALQGIAHSKGGRVAQVKLHGALANMVCEDFELAKICIAAINACDKTLPVVVMPGTQLDRAAKAAECRTISEIYADRNYNEDATLVSRDAPDALITDHQMAANRMVEILKTGMIICLNGKRMALEAQTICVHGDSPHALKMARTIRETLENAGIKVANIFS